MAWSGCTRPRPRPTCRCCGCCAIWSATAFPPTSTSTCRPFCWSSSRTRTSSPSFPNIWTRKITAAREDEAFFIQSGDTHLAETARFWGRFFSAALDDFNALGGDIVRGFRHFTMPA